MKRRMRRLLGAALGTALALTFTGCGQKTEVVEEKERAEIVFSWWGNDNRHEYTIRAIREFEARHPQIKVIFKYGDWNGYEERTDIEMASRTEADVMQINYPWLYKYSPDGERFYDIYKNRGDIDLVSFSAEEEEMGTINGKLNALPTSINTSVFYWNKTMLDSYGLELPETWDDLFHMAEVLRADGIYPLTLEPKFAWILCTAYTEQQTGKAILNEDGSLGFGEAEFQQMLEFYARLIEEGVTTQPDSFERSYLSEGEYAGTLSWISSGDVCCEDAAANGYEMVAGDFLQTPGQTRSGWYRKPAQYYAVSANTKHPKEAVLLMHFLLNSEEMASQQKLEKGIPVSAKAQNYLKKNGLMQGFAYDAYQKMEEAADQINHMSPYFENEDWIAQFCSTADLVQSGKKKSDAAAKEFYAFLQG